MEKNCEFYCGFRINASRRVAILEDHGSETF
jgi:hypothetical protein